MEHRRVIYPWCTIHNEYIPCLSTPKPEIPHNDLYLFYCPENHFGYIPSEVSIEHVQNAVNYH